MHGVRPGQYDALDHWLALADLKTAPKLFLCTPLPDDQTMCEMYMSIIEPMPWTPGPVHRLSVAAYHPLGITSDVNQLPPQIFLRFPQPLAFVAKLVGGMTDIPVKSMMMSSRCRPYVWFLCLPLVVQGDPADDRCMSHWSRDALAITKALARSKAALARAARASKLIPRRRNPHRGPRWVRGKTLRAL
ncbi:hypothetical protein B0H14DRAFT_3456327 [Mycena olivaceomarginata]|nr:hypothetical protein B0H14DRAFT_3456327 [Mycena olivaceomarginata]